MDKFKKWSRRASGRDTGSDSDTDSGSDRERYDRKHFKSIEHSEHVGAPQRPSIMPNVKRASEPVITFRTSDQLLDPTTAGDLPLTNRRPTFSRFDRSLSASLPGGSSSTLGLTLIHCPPDPLFDLIFIHGLGGSSHGTWSYERDTRYFWPPWLADDIGLSSCRTFTFGYDAAFASHFSSAGILDFAKDLLFRMKTFSGDSAADGPQIGKLPIAFVTHSMGGLVAKKAYIIGQSDANFSDILGQVQAFIFLATPHKGSQSADMLNSILKALPQGAPKQYVADLTQNSGALQEINEQFRNMCADLHLISFHETQKTNLGGGLKRLVVDKESSLLGYPGEQSSSLVADHHGMTKFKSRQDSNYIDVRNAIRYVVRDHVSSRLNTEMLLSPRRLSNATTVVTDSKSTHELSSRQRLKTALGIDDTVEDQLDYFSERTMHGTCQWLLNRQYFREWAASGSKASGILWMTAGPGSGKSTWASVAISWLKRHHYHGTCQHHFFQGSNQQRRTIAYCLRSIAFQVALINSDFCTRLLELCGNTGMTFEQQKAAVIWEKIFDGILFASPIDQPLFWVFDGLDESESHADLLKLLSKIKAWGTVNVLFFSRFENTISRDMNLYLPERLHRHISPGDLFDDISSYVRNSIRHVLSDPSHEEIVDQILAKAAGSFLWVKLALDKIKNDWHTRDGIMRALNEVPEGMESTFTRMINDISKQPTHLRTMAIRILTWTVCSFRPLRIEELGAALSPEFTGFVNLANTVEDVCGQFAVISKDVVSLVHETARVFLLQKKSQQSISIDAMQGHEHAAQTCIQYLSDIPKWKRIFESIQSAQNSKSNKQDPTAFDGQPFLVYALYYWSYHVSHAPVDSDELLEKTLEFLETKLLLWINGVALTGNLVILIKTAENLKTFLKRRARAERKRIAMYTTSRDEQLDSWATDIVRVLGRFGTNIRQDPSCVYKYLVPFCPEDSIIHRSFTNITNSSFTVLGKFKSWDDCLARLRISDNEMATKLLCKDKFFVGVAGTSGTLMIWHAETYEELRMIQHKEYVSCLAASSISSQVVTAGHKTTRIWNINTGEELMQLPRNSHAKTLALAFGANDAELLIASDDCMVRCINLSTGEEKWTSKVKETSIDDYTCPRNMAFSPDLRHVAVVYRGRPVFVWKLQSSSPPKRCVCLEDRFATEGGAWNASEKAIWHPDNDHVLILYEDTKIMYWNVADDEQVQHNHTGARAMALRPDGNLLLTSDVTGSLSIWTIPEFRLTYQLRSDELVTDLAFFMDGSRFCDIRGEYCNVWESDALIKANEIDDDDVSSINDTSLSEPILSTDLRSRENVTAISCDSSDKYYCCGFDDGTVSIFDITDGKKVRNKVMIHDDTTSVIKLVWSDSEDYLASANDSSRVIVKRIERPTKQKPKWAVFPVFDINTNEAVEQLLFSAHGDLLLVSCSDTAIVLDVVRKKEICRTRLPLSRGSFWVTNPLNPSSIVRVDESHETYYDWAKLATADLSIHEQLDHFSLSRSRYTIHKAFMNRRNIWALELTGGATYANEIELLTFQTPSKSGTDSTTVRNKVKGLSAVAEDLLGCFQDRIVFLDHNYWVCTWNIAPQYTRHQRHFFLPNYLLNPTSLSMIRLNRQGTLLCPQGKDVIIVRSGLQG